VNKQYLLRSDSENGLIIERASSEERSGSTKKNGAMDGTSLMVVRRLCSNISKT
jgi:hypothetical protein